MDTREQVIGKQRLYTKKNVQAVVLFLSFFEATDDEDGKLGM